MFPVFWSFVTFQALQPVTPTSPDTDTDTDERTDGTHVREAITGAGERADAVQGQSTRDDGDVVDATQVGAATVFHTPESTHVAREDGVILDGEEYLATDAAVNLQEVR